MKNRVDINLGGQTEPANGAEPLEPSITFTLKGQGNSEPPSPTPGNLPRITRLLALAIKMDEMVASGIVRDYADLARLGFVSRPRITQVMNLLCLAPDIQEEILDMPRTTQGRDPVSEGHVRGMASELDWDRQRKMWRDVRE